MLVFIERVFFRAPLDVYCIHADAAADEKRFKGKKTAYLSGL